MTDALSLPPKPEVALALLQTASSVYVHLDPRKEGVFVPPWFKKQPQLVLQVGLNMAVPIPDLDVGDEALSCTLSFNRRPEFCRIPWDAIYGLVGDDGRGMIWPESIPPEVAAAGDGRGKPADAKERRFSVVGSEKPEAVPAAEPQKTPTSLPPKASTTRPPKSNAPPRSSAPPASKRELPSYLRVVK